MKPNLFILGAAKSGTTSLHNYLSHHQDILMSQPKEPKYFSYITGNNKFEGPGDDKVLESIAKTEREYDKAFELYSGESIVGESSADYLYYYRSVIPKLLDEGYKDAKFIIILRNPFERTKSSYNHLIRDQRETLIFSEALKAESSRINTGWEFIWHYKNASLYHDAVKNYIESFDNVKIVIFEQIFKDLQKFMNEIFEFLNVDQIKIDNIKLNHSEVLKYPIINRFLHSNSSFKHTVAKILKLVFGNKKTMDFKRKIMHKNSKKRDVCTTNEIIHFKKEFNTDISKLEKLLNINLSEWK